MVSSLIDYIPLSVLCIGKHIGFLFTSGKWAWGHGIEPEIVNKEEQVIYGYSCRSLFYTLLDVIVKKKNNKNIKILVSPLHHTSWRNIIEYFFDDKQITVLPMNKTYNKVLVPEEIYSKSYDICIITHMFGQDIDTTELSKVNQDCLFIEDRVQGGTFSKKYSSPRFDMSLYSCGMDKTPCALGGGLLYYKSHYTDIADLIHNQVKTYKKETIQDRSIFLIKKIPTYILYNFRSLFYIFRLFIIFIGLDLQYCIKYYRKINPGFTHTNYNILPHDSTLNSIIYSMKNFRSIETEQVVSHTIYKGYLDIYNLFDKHYPWCNGKQLTIYNAVTVENKIQFITFCNNRYVPVLENPTYKLFTFEYSNKHIDNTFNDSIVFIPSIYNLPPNKLKQLSLLLMDWKINQHRLENI